MKKKQSNQLTSATSLDRTLRHSGANATQRRRRTVNPRIDYYPSEWALAYIRSRQGQEGPGSVRGTNSAILDAIVAEWAELTGINKRPEIAPITPAAAPELTDANARARMTPGKFCQALKAGASAENKAKQSQRVPCGARRRRDGLPCQALSVPGRRRCKWHGGLSTGPRSVEGRVRAQANLRRGAAPFAIAINGLGVDSIRLFDC